MVLHSVPRGWSPGLQFRIEYVNVIFPKYDFLHDNPTRNTLHVTFMYHAIIIDLHALHNMHVVMLMYMNVSCNRVSGKAGHE